MAIHAPEFPTGVPWFNCDGPLSLRSLRGRPVLLHFWTHACINCMHVHGDVEHLQDIYGPRGLVVIGVHSAKFDREEKVESVARAIERFDITHPVVVDEKRRIWDEYAVKAWPTFVVIDQNGLIVDVRSGEGKLAFLEKSIGALLRTPSVTRMDRPNRRGFDDALHLRFPGKAIGVEGEDGVSFFVSDTGNDRIVQLDARGRRVTSFGEAELVAPQGLCRIGEELIVCDTGNHRVVAFSLSTDPERSFRDVAGSRQLGFLPLEGSLDALEAPLNSPWDVVPFREGVAVACAGSHQLAYVNLAEGIVETLAGTGFEHIVDGPAESAALAQPQGLARLSQTALAFVDAESSALRLLEARPSAQEPKGSVVTEFGTGLFDFGHRDGPVSDALLQHPMGCAVSGVSPGMVYVADSFNGVVRLADIIRHEIMTIALGVELHEPGGVSVCGGYVVIADTNAHRIVVVPDDPEAFKRGQSVTVEVFSGPFGVTADFGTTGAHRKAIV